MLFLSRRHRLSAATAAFLASASLLGMAGCRGEMEGLPVADTETTMRALVDTQLRFAAEQYLRLSARTPADRMPRSYDAAKDEQVTSDTQWWTSGFYPGTLWMLYGYTRDARLREEAERRLALLEKEQHFTGNHDIGFMIFDSYGTAYRITGNPRYLPVIETAAETATKRFRPAMGAIQSWDASENFRAPVIIDNMMNLELLLWTAERSGNDRYRQIARRHADTTLANHFRPDCSSYHIVDFDPETGAVLGRRTWQGAGDGSAWARGQGWGLYGFTMLYRYTREPRYLAKARCIADFILDHPHLPADGVPYWDFDAPGIPDALRDASAASLNASALLELGRYVPAPQRERYVAAAARTLRTLSAPPYRAEAGTNGGFILKHGVGAAPFNSEVDVPLTYADYYYVEALLRYRDWYLTP